MRPLVKIPLHRSSREVRHYLQKSGTRLVEKIKTLEKRYAKACVEYEEKQLAIAKLDTILKQRQVEAARWEQYRLERREEVIGVLNDQAVAMARRANRAPRMKIRTKRNVKLDGD